MKKALRILIAMAVVSTVLFGGLAGSAAAYDKTGDSQTSVAVVAQEQNVAQTNVNVQDDNTAVGLLGDATAVQASEQTNNNAQVGIADA